MIGADSLLRRLPPSLNREQTLYLDGIRHAAEIADLAYRRLLAQLTELALTREDQELKRGPLFSAAFLDAWAIVDALDRLHSLLRQMPGAIGPPAEVKSDFRLSGQEVRALRNVADHVGTRIKYIMAKKGTALGVLSWFTITSAGPPLTGVACMILPGTLSATSQAFANPAGQALQAPTDLVHLAAGEYRSSISDAVSRAREAIKTLEASLEKALSEAGVLGEQAGSDALIALDMVFPSEGGAEGETSTA